MALQHKISPHLIENRQQHSFVTHTYISNNVACCNLLFRPIQLFTNLSKRKYLIKDMVLMVLFFHINSVITISSVLQLFFLMFKKIFLGLHNYLVNALCKVRFIRCYKVNVFLIKCETLAPGNWACGWQLSDPWCLVATMVPVIPVPLVWPAKVRNILGATRSALARIYLCFCF